MTNQWVVDLVGENFRSLLFTVCSKQAEGAVEERSASVNFISMATFFPKLLVYLVLYAGKQFTLSAEIFIKDYTRLDT
jgi:hypothetical protein